MARQETTHAERVSMVERHQAGETLRSIAESMGLNYYTVRTWWRVYQDQGWAGLVPRGRGPPQVGLLGRFPPLVKYVALRLKREHPGWGVDYLLLQLARRPSLRGLVLPKRSALAGYLAQFGQRLYRQRRPPTRRPAPSQPRAQVPHECWQTDFKGEEQVGGCGLVITPLMVCDEASGAPLAGFVHQVQARGQRKGLTTRHVQHDLRQVFIRWGLPDALRMDRDPLFVGCARRQWPGTLLLWLVALGVLPVVNRAYRPTDNAIVERNHWTWELHVLLGQRYTHLAHVQQETDRSFADRREHLPSRHVGCHGRPPAQAFPALYTARRPFAAEQEAALFDLARVDAYLSQWQWRRVVDCTGKISLANRNHRVGYAYRGQMVKVAFDPQHREFVCSLADGTQVARLTLVEVSQDYILGLN